MLPGQYDDLETEEQSLYAADLAEAAARAGDYGAESHTKRGNVHTFLPLELPEGEGEYWKLVYTEGETDVHVFRVRRYPKYADWQTTETVEYSAQSLAELWLMNADAEYPADDANVPLSQTLFNTDDKYEYLAPTLELSQTPDYSNVLDYAYRDGAEPLPIRRETVYTARTTGYDVLSEDGAVLHHFAGSYLRQLLVMGGKTYLVMEDGDKAVFYAIDRRTSSVSQVAESALRLHPRLARRSEYVTLETDEAASRESREVVITAMDGHTVQRLALPAGQRSLRIATARMEAGAYQISIVGGRRRTDAGRLIVR